VRPSAAVAVGASLWRLMAWAHAGRSVWGGVPSVRGWANHN
jgi:hypothetical protein